MAIQAGIFTGLSVLLGVLLSLKFPFNLIVSFYLTVFLSRKWLKSRRNKFAQLVNSQLPEVSRMLASCLRAGMSIQQSIETVARELKAPAGPLFNAMSQQLHLGTSVEAVFEKMSERFSSKDFQLLLKTIIIQRKAGGNLGQALDHLAKTLEDRARMNQELSNQTAESRYIAITLAVIPIVLIIGFNVVFDGFIMPLFTIPGLILLVVVAILMTIGFLAIRKVSNIKA
ncbi:type II secretion system F family protein [Paenibacillus sp. CC-CFT747]|nr:type II secretion system F family protein [Paenibacillus sp. CC-CFT747]